MNTYLFKTTATMKEYNNKKWWIDSKIVSDLNIKATNICEALKEYKHIVEKRFHINISNNALKNKSEIYIDTETGETIQTGYVITGKTEFEDRDNYRWSEQYIDLWVYISIVKNPFVSEV